MEMKKKVIVFSVATGLLVASHRADAGDAVSLKPIAEGLTAPNLATHAGDGSGRLFITDQTGQIRIVDAEGKLLKKAFLDVSSRMVKLGAFGPGSFDERGLLGLAFHPNFGGENGNGKFYIYYSAPRAPDISISFEEQNIPRGKMEFTFRDIDFAGGIVGTQGEPPLYGSGDFAFEIPAEGKATVTLPRVAVEVRFFFVHRGEDDAGMVQAFDIDGNPLGDQVGSNEATFQNDPENFVTLADRRTGIAELRFEAGKSDPGNEFTLFMDDLDVSNYNHKSRISEFKVSENDPNIADPDSERVLLEIDEPQFNHNSGMIAFGPDDGFLYIAVGDGGNANDVGPGHNPDIGNGQDKSTLLGNILRIDVDHGNPYAIPEDNPFVGRQGRDEIWAYGFRNPFRFSFDMEGDHELFVADVGQALFEEVDIVERGQNYGWNIKEGFHCFDPKNNQQPPKECPDVGREGEPLIDPIIEYTHAGDPFSPHGISVIGGYIYRGSALPRLTGKLVFGDWSRPPFGGPLDGSLFSAGRLEGGGWDLADVKNGNELSRRLKRLVLGFGQDAEGEMYLCTSRSITPNGQTGVVFKLIAPPDCGLVKRLKLKCRSNNRIVAKVRSNLPEGTMLHLDNDGDNRTIVIGANGNVKTKYREQVGERKIIVVECPHRARTIECDK